MFVAEQPDTLADAAVRAGTTTPTELVEACLEQIAATEDRVHSLVLVLADSARAEAAELDVREPMGPLHGVPIALKDLLHTAGVATEANCEALRGFVPDRDASVVARLKAAGAIVMGKTNTHELAFGVSCPASYNPWDVTRMTGGSSGGNASALAARQVYGTVGTDTGGSVRIPSNYCGTTGIKTTRGLVPRDGLHLLSSTYDTVGPMARTAIDCGLLLEVMAGPSTLDPKSSHHELDPPRSVRDLRLGVPAESFFDGIEMNPQVRATMDAAIELLKGLMSDVSHVDVPHTSDHAAAGPTIVGSEAAELLADLREHRGDLIGEEVRAILEFGAVVPPSDLDAAQLQRQQIESRYLEIFEQGVDVLISPVCPNLPPAHGATALHGEPLTPATTKFTFPVNGAGLPAIALPGGFSDDGLPIGFQLIGRAFSERTLVAVGAAFQTMTDHHEARPPI